MSDSLQTSTAIQESPQQPPSTVHSATLPSIRSFRTRFLFGKTAPTSKKRSSSRSGNPTPDSLSRKSVGDLFPVDVGNQSLDHHLGRPAAQDLSRTADTLPRMNSQPVLRPLAGNKRKSWDFSRVVSLPQPSPLEKITSEDGSEKVIDVRATTPPPTLPQIETSNISLSKAIPPRSPDVTSERPSIDARPSIDSIASSSPTINSADITRVVDLSAANITIEGGRLGDLARELGEVIADRTTISLLQALETGNISLIEDSSADAAPSEAASPAAKTQERLKEMKSSVDRMEAIVAERDSKIFIGNPTKASALDISFQSSNIDVDALEDHLNQKFGQDFVKEMIDSDSILEQPSPTESDPLTPVVSKESAEDMEGERVSLDLGSLDPDLAALLSPHNLLDAAASGEAFTVTSPNKTIKGVPLGRSTSTNGFIASTPAKPSSRRTSFQPRTTPSSPLTMSIPIPQLTEPLTAYSAPLTPLSMRGSERSHTPTQGPLGPSSSTTSLLAPSEASLSHRPSSPSPNPSASRPPRVSRKQPPPLPFLTSQSPRPTPTLSVNGDPSLPGEFGESIQVTAQALDTSSGYIGSASSSRKPSPKEGSTLLPRQSPRDSALTLGVARTFSPRSSPRNFTSALASPHSLPRDVSPGPLPRQSSLRKKERSASDGGTSPEAMVPRFEPSSGDTPAKDSEILGDGEDVMTPQVKPQVSLSRRVGSPPPMVLSEVNVSIVDTVQRKRERDLEEWRREIPPLATSTPNLNFEPNEQMLTVSAATNSNSDVSPATSAGSGSGNTSSPVLPQASSYRRRPRASTSASELVPPSLNLQNPSTAPAKDNEPFARPRTSAAHYTPPTPGPSTSVFEGSAHTRPKTSVGDYTSPRRSYEQSSRDPGPGRYNGLGRLDALRDRPLEPSRPPPFVRSFTSMGTHSRSRQEGSDTNESPSSGTIVPRLRTRRSYSIDNGPAGDLAIRGGRDELLGIRPYTASVVPGRTSMDSQITHSGTRSSLDLNRDRAQTPFRNLAIDPSGPSTKRAFTAAGLLTLDGEGEEGLRSRSGSLASAATSASGARLNGWRTGSNRFANGDDANAPPSPSSTYNAARTLYSGASTISSSHPHTSSTAITTITTASSSSTSIQRLQQQHDEAMCLMRDQHENELEILRDRHELEKEALLMSIGESKRVNRQLVQENEDLQNLVKEMEQRLAAAMDMNTRLAAGTSPTPTRTAMGHYPPQASVNHRFTAGRRIAPPRGIPSTPSDRLQPLRNNHPTEVERRRDLIASATPLASRARPSEGHRMTEINDVSMLEDITAFSSIRARKAKNRRSISEASMLMPAMAPSRSMSMLLDEPPPAGHRHYASSNSSSPASPNLILPNSIHEPILEVDSSMDASDLRVDLQVGATASSPNSTSFSYAESAIPPSPGSLKLKLSDELHLNDFVSLRHSDGEDDHDMDDGDDEDTDWTETRRHRF